MLTRKRTWYSVKDHLTNYGDFDALQPALKELADAGFLLTPASLHVDLINQLKRAQGEILDEQREPELEPLALLLDSLTMGSLKEI